MNWEHLITILDHDNKILYTIYSPKIRPAAAVHNSEPPAKTAGFCNSAGNLFTAANPAERPW